MRKKSANVPNDQQKLWRPTAYHRGTRDGSPSYVLLYSDGELSGEEEETSLSSRSKKVSPPRKIEVIEVKLKSEDTLQALALRYGCKISELKRINMIHKENEIHARRVIQIPVPPFSILTEIETDRNEESASPDIVTSHEDKIMNLISNPLPQVEINHMIWNSIRDPLQSCQEVDEGNENTEQDQLLSNAESGNVEHIDTFQCSGADWGISWLQLLVVSLLFCFGGPLIYLIYLESYSHHYSTVNHSSNAETRVVN